MSDLNPTPTDGNPTPGTECPDWCVMHLEGKHVGELSDPHPLKQGYTMYSRPIDEGDGRVGMQLVVLNPEGEHVTIPLPSAALTAADGRE
ncbi:hypothetical protein ACIBTV_25550 [Micromonospora sp. NPDC049366]|uniref:hypothetical protein n=1 Tax=Micromonospora sp. NPDC049366 TaxID=3364271 RepID=UPI003794828B